jgi:hypothetical protein
VKVMEVVGEPAVGEMGRMHPLPSGEVVVSEAPMTIVVAAETPPAEMPIAVSSAAMSSTTVASTAMASAAMASTTMSSAASRQRVRTYGKSQRRCEHRARPESTMRHGNLRTCLMASPAGRPRARCTSQRAEFIPNWQL